MHGNIPSATENKSLERIVLEHHRHRVDPAAAALDARALGPHAGLPLARRLARRRRAALAAAAEEARGRRGEQPRDVRSSWATSRRARANGRSATATSTLAGATLPAAASPWTTLTAPRSSPAAAARAFAAAHALASPSTSIVSVDGGVPRRLECDHADAAARVEEHLAVAHRRRQQRRRARGPRAAARGRRRARRAARAAARRAAQTAAARR